MRNLRTQLLASHLLLLLLMLIVMVGGVMNVFHLGRSIDRILRDNYKSVVAAQRMNEALERQDSAATLLLAGQALKARQEYEANRGRFESAYAVEAGNVTERGEQHIVDEIGQQYQQYQGDLARLIEGGDRLTPAAARQHYIRALEPRFAVLKARIQAVLDLNQAAIVRADARAKAEARTAAWAGMGVAAVALLVALLFSLRMVHLIVQPMAILARQAEGIGAGRLGERIHLRRSDEVGTLAEAFNRMAGNLAEARRREEARLHRAERMSDEALDSLYDPVVVTDSAGRVVHLNRAAEGLFGPAEHAVGLAAADVVREARIARAIERAIHQERVSADEGDAGMVPLQVGPAERTYRLRATPMQDDDGALLGAVAVLEDVTHLRELDRLKTEFVSVASHELRTPVTSLLLSVQLLQEGAVGALTPQQLEVVAAQSEDLQRLDRMMRDLLDLTRLEAGATPPRLGVVAPADLISQAAHSVAPQADAKGVCLQDATPAGLPAVRADRAQIVRVLVNLLNNAVRHTPAGGTVSVDACADARQVTIRVRDTGTGIPAEYLPLIFERFVQVPGATRGGAGLGLSIARTILKSHGGAIWAESQPGKGSAFSVSLPVARVGV